MKNFISKKAVLGFVVLLVIFVSLFGSTKTKNNNSNLTASVRSALVTDSSGSDESITKFLRLGNRGDEVRTLQEFLSNQGYDLGIVDGIFGLKTRSSLKSFQKDNGLQITGNINIESKDFINEKLSQKEEEIVEEEILENPEIKDEIIDNLKKDDLLQNKKYTGPSLNNELSAGSKGVEVAMLQQFLNQSGYNLGGADGNFGPRTMTALKNFQTKNNLAVSGNLDKTTRDFINNLIKEGNFDFSTIEQDYNNQQKKEEENKKQIEEKQKQEEEAKQQALQKQKELTLEFLDLNGSNTLFKDYSCKEEDNEKLFVLTGEYIDETKNAIGRLADVWSTTDGTNWKKEADTTNIGEGWERMVLKVGDTVYSFGGKYKASSSSSDNGVYKSKNMVDWTYVGEIPEMSHYYDRSVAYFKDKFWLISSEEGKHGVWSSSTGEKWTEELTNTPWDGIGKDTVENNKGYYDSNSLGAYVIDNKMWYIVYNNQAPQSGQAYDPVMSIYSTSDGKNWTNEGYLKNSETSNNFSIRSNVNPMPVYFNDKVWIVASNRKTDSVIVINTSDGKNWKQVSDSGTSMGTMQRFYATLATFRNKIWAIGGWDVRGNSEANNNTNDIWASSDGSRWSQMTPKGISVFPGPADRHLAAAMSLGATNPAAANLVLEREYNVTSFLTGKLQEDTTLGRWKLTSKSGTKNTGDIVINDLSFLGNDYKNYSGKTFSSLEYAQNIKIYADDVKIAEIKNFAGPFYDKDGIPLEQKITLTKPFTIKKDSSVWIKLVADFTAPNYLNFEMRTFLTNIGFKNEFSTPCSISSEDYSGGYKKFPGRNMYYKR